MDQKAKQDRSYIATGSERQQYENNWKLSLNAQGRNAPMTESRLLQSFQGNQRFASGRRTGKSFSDFTEPSDSSKTISRRAKEMEYLVRTIFVLVMDRVANLVDLRSGRTTMTTETQDADCILSLVPTMNKHEVPSYYSSHANNITMVLQSGSITFGKIQYVPAYNNPVRIHCKAGSVCRQDSYLKHEPNVKTLLFEIKMMVARTKLTVPSAAPKQQSRCVNPNRLKTGRLENNLRLCGRELADQLKILFPDGDDEGAFIFTALDAHSHVLSIKDRRNGVGKPVFNLASVGSEQLFTLVAPDLYFPGVFL